MFSRQERGMLRDIAALLDNPQQPDALRRMERRTTNYRKVLRSRINKKVRVALNDLQLYQRCASELPLITKRK